jgi:hypothetical protein
MFARKMMGKKRLCTCALFSTLFMWQKWEKNIKLHCLWGKKAAK